MYAAASAALRVAREPLETLMLLGLRTAIYHTPDIVAGKLWYTKVLGFPPYFDQPFYVGFNVGGFELGLTPDGGKTAAGAYWGVKDIESVLARLLELGAEPRTRYPGRRRGHSRGRCARSVGQCVRHHRKPELQAARIES